MAFNLGYTYTAPQRRQRQIALGPAPREPGAEGYAPSYAQAHRLDLAGVLAPQSAPEGPLDFPAIKRKAMIDALNAGMTAPIQGDGSGWDWAQGLVRGGEAFFRARGARDERKTEEEERRLKLAMALERQQREREAAQREANKPMEVSPGATVLRPDGTVLYTAPDQDQYGAVTTYDSVIPYNKRTGELLDPTRVTPRPVSSGGAAAQMNKPPWERRY